MSKTQLATAISRLQTDYKEVLKSPIEGISAIPLEDNILEWHCNIQYQDAYFHIILTFPDNYPAKSPSAEFMPYFRFTQGATREGINGGTRVCLNIFSDFAEIHTEWANEKGVGWSVSYTTQIVLLNLLSFLQEASGGSFYSYGQGSMEENIKVSKGFSCKKCGHSPSNVFPPMPKEIPKVKVQANSDPIDDITCYISKTNFKSSPPNEIWGFGISKSGKPPNYNLTSPCEWLTLSSFKELSKTGKVESVFRDTIDYFLPLYISDDHWKNASNEFIKSMSYASGIKDSTEAIFKTLPKLLNSSVVLYMNSSQNAHVSENALNGYFLFVQLFKQAIKSNPKIQQKVEKALQDFTTVASARTKSQCPNIGELLALLVISENMNFEKLASSYINENFLRNVMWYTRTDYSLSTSKISQQNRLEKTFELTKVSRDLAVFQVCFLRTLKLEVENNNGYPTQKQKEYLFGIVKSLKTMKNYQEWFEIIGVKYPGDISIANHLWDSVEKSQKMEGYFFSNNNNKNRNNNYKNNRGNYRGNNNRGRGNRY